MLQKNKKLCKTRTVSCPGFGQDRVNFHRTPGRGTARGVEADPTWPNRARYSIPCDVTLSSGGGCGAVGTRSQLGSSRRRSCPGERVCCASMCRIFLLICIVVVTVPSVRCSVKLPLSRPTSFCLFLSILLRTAAGGGTAAWRFCCRLQSKPEQTVSSAIQKLLGNVLMKYTCFCSNWFLRYTNNR